MEGRGLIIPDKDRAEFYLSQLGYYRFAAYCRPYESDHKTHRFQPDTHFDDVLSLYIFDRELRLLILDAIERIEISLRTQLAYHLSHIHQTSHPHLNSDIFSNSRIYRFSLNELRKNIKRSQEDFVKHFTEHYEEPIPPIWAVVELMTMGQLPKWFSNVKKRSDRQKISKVYELNEKIMVSLCEHLSIIRNYAAHHARLWNRSFTVISMLPYQADSNLTGSLLILPDTDKRLRKLYNSTVMITYLMGRVSGDSQWKRRLIKLTEKYSVDTEKMGFPEDWRSRPIWQ